MSKEIIAWKESDLQLISPTSPSHLEEMTSSGTNPISGRNGLETAQRAEQHSDLNMATDRIWSVYMNSKILYRIS